MGAAILGLMGRGCETGFCENGAGLSVTQSGDPLSGGHFCEAASKAPPGSARERSRVVIHILSALHLADSENRRRRSGVSEGPISNG